jgi:hypothetical protein
VLVEVLAVDEVLVLVVCDVLVLVLWDVLVDVLVVAVVVVVAVVSSVFTSEANASTAFSTVVVSPFAAPQSVSPSAFCEAAVNLMPHPLVSTLMPFAAAFESPARMQLAFLPAAFSFAPWHLLGVGPPAVMEEFSLEAKVLTLFSIAFWSPWGATQSLPPSAFVNAAVNLAWQVLKLVPVILVAFFE